MSMSFILLMTVVNGYHIYYVVLVPQVTESSLTLQESTNIYDKHGMAINRYEKPV